jgi:hypothetical protein
MARIGITRAEDARNHRPRGSRYLVPRDSPRYGELAAVLAVSALLAHLLLAQLTLLLTAAMFGIAWASRWRPQWLAVPAGAGLVWTLAIGLARACRGLAAGPRQVIGYLAGIGGHPGHLLHPQDTFAGLSHWLPQQFPLALILAAAETLGLCWLQRRLGNGREWRTGLIVAGRRWLTTAWFRSGGVVTRDGAILGVDLATGRPASISWREAEGGVLCTGLAQDGFPLTLAAIRRRKPVIVIDLAASPALAAALSSAGQELDAPFCVFGQDGSGCYEPLRGGDPARAARMITAVIDWSDVSDQRRRSCAAYLADALAVQAAARGDRTISVLEDLLPLLSAAGLRERAALIPAYHPRRDVLADRAAVSASLLQADPAMTAAPVEQLSSLLASPAGRWLRPASPDPVLAGATPNMMPISLGQTVRERGVTLFSLDRAAHGDAARMIAGLVIADLIAVATELEEMSISGDTLIWLNGYEALGQKASGQNALGHKALADLIGQLIGKGPAAGIAVVLSTTSVAAAETLAAGVSVLAAGWPVDPVLASRFVGPPGIAPDGTTADGSALDGLGLDGSAATPPGGSPAAGLARAGAGLLPGLNGTEPPDVRGRSGHGFALLARGERGAQPRVLAHCRSSWLDGMPG